MNCSPLHQTEHARNFGHVSTFYTVSIFIVLSKVLHGLNSFFIIMRFIKRPLTMISILLKTFSHNTETKITANLAYEIYIFHHLLYRE